MKRNEIYYLKNHGLSNDEIYRIAAGNINLFGVAFFGHKGKPGDKKRLSTLWKRILKYN